MYVCVYLYIHIGVGWTRGSLELITLCNSECRFVLCAGSISEQSILNIKYIRQVIGVHGSWDGDSSLRTHSDHMCAVPSMVWSACIVLAWYLILLNNESTVFSTHRVCFPYWCVCVMGTPV